MAAAISTRVVTAAPGVQPAWMSDEPKAPAVPKVAADSTARMIPAPRTDPKPMSTSMLL